MISVDVTKARLGDCQEEIISVYRLRSGQQVPWGGKRHDGELHQLSQAQPIGTHLSVCLLDVLRFDNTYSFVHAKKVSFTVEVLLPDEGMQKYDEELTPI